MGVPLSELVLESVIRDGLGAIRADLDILDDLFSKFNLAYFSTQYGQSKIDEIKTYIQNNQIRIVQSWAMVPMSVPCISIQLEAASEDPDIQQFSNEYEEIDTDITPTIVIDPVTPGTYNPVTGKLIIANPDDVDLSLICPGMNYIDASGTPFSIQAGNSNITGNKFINIGQAKEPDLSDDGRIESSIDKKRTERRMIRMREVISLGCHASNDIHLAKFIYYILIYILKSRQASIIDRGLELDFSQGSMYNRDDKFEGENIFSRFIRFNCISQFDWDQEEVNLIDCFELTLKAPAPNPKSQGTVTITKTGD